MTLRYVSSQKMKEIDRTAIELYGISALTLMENAGKAVADEAMKMLKRGSVAVFCGYGNNGGDGFVAARHLIERRYRVRVFLVGKAKQMSAEAEESLAKLKKAGGRIETIVDSNGTGRTHARTIATDLVIDAIFGTGIKGSLDNFFVSLIEDVNGLRVPVLSIDVPSGLDADSGAPCPVAVVAKKTVTLGLPKDGFKNPAAEPYVGELVVADIGIPAAAVESVCHHG